MIANSLIAHRGCALIAPENSMSAMRMTKALGVDWVEVDANLMGDGTVVVFHDQTVDRLTQHSGSLLNYKSEDLTYLETGTHFSPFFLGEPIPTLKDLLVFLSDSKMGLNLEIKLYPGFSPADIVTPVIDLLELHWWNFDKLIISSFSTEVLQLIAERRPSWQIGQLWMAIPDDWARVADSLQLASVHCSYHRLSLQQANAIKSAGLDLYVYTVNDGTAAQALYELGVDGLITDDPRLFKRVV